MPLRTKKKNSGLQKVTTHLASTCPTNDITMLIIVPLINFSNSDTPTLECGNSFYF